MAPGDLTLYYFPGSFYSSKAVLALYEKDLTFKDHYINITAGEQNEKDYLTNINSKGLVPVLKDGDTLIPESDDIIDYLDKKYDSGTTLVPDVSTPLGQKVQDFRKCSSAVKIEIITFGIICNRKLSPRGLQWGKFMNKMANREAAGKRFSSEIQRLKAVQQAHPALREITQSKILKVEKFLADMMDEEIVTNALDDLEEFFDKIESLLKDNTQGADPDKCWLFGPSFTAADLNVAVLFFRLQKLGVDVRYFSETKRPLVFAYSTRLMNRPSVLKMVEGADNAVKAVLQSTVQKTAGKLLKWGIVGGVIALGFLGLRELLKARRGIARA